MTRPKHTFPLFAHAYLWLSLVVWCGGPLWFTLLESIRDDVGLGAVYLGAFASALICACVQFANIKCSGPKVSFFDGLLMMACFMRTGWTYTSLMMVLLATPIALVASTSFAVLSVLMPASRFRSTEAFCRLLVFFQRNRMVQD